MRRAIAAATLLSLASLAHAADNESPEGRWGLTTRDCRSADADATFTVRLRPGAGAAVESDGRPCRLDRMADTRIGYRLFLRCYVSREDFQADAHPVRKSVVFDAISSERMRADGRIVYRCPQG